MEDFHGMLLLKQFILAGQFPDFKKKIRAFSSALPLVQQLKNHRAINSGGKTKAKPVYREWKLYELIQHIS